MTKHEYIKTLSTKELASLFQDTLNCSRCAYRGDIREDGNYECNKSNSNNGHEDCIDGCEEWLNQEVEVN